MSTPVYRDAVSHIASGAPGRASSVSGPDRQLESNIQYLKSVFDAANLGSGIYGWNQAVEPTIQVGQPVYWNGDNGRFEKALAAVENDPTTGTMVATDSADCCGIVASKASSAVANILFAGCDTIDISAAVDGGVSAGRYYLSSSEAGKLVQQRPPITCFVLRSFGNGDVLVLPDMKDFLEDHVHFNIELEAQPAGDCVAQEDGTHTVVNPTTSRRGWLPANHESFGGRAPEGAKFGYNMAQHAALQQVWPPIPIDAVMLEMLRPSDPAGTTQVYGRITEELVQFDVNGIWWMSDCFNQAPWPSDCGNSASSSVSCPAEPPMRLLLSFIKMTFQTG